MSLQYLKKELKNEVHCLHAIKYQSVATTFVFYCYAKHLDILCSSSHIHCYSFPCTVEIFCLNTTIQ